MAAIGHRDEEVGTGREGAWARGLPQDGGVGGECLDPMRPHWNHHGHGETGGSCLWGGKKTKNKQI